MSTTTPLRTSPSIRVCFCVLSSSVVRHTHSDDNDDDDVRPMSGGALPSIAQTGALAAAKDGAVAAGTLQSRFVCIVHSGFETRLREQAAR